MTTLTTPSTPAAAAHRSAHQIRLSFGGILNSEWIKLRSLRSTVWSFAVLFALQFAFGIGLVLINLQVNDGAPLSSDAATGLATVSSTLGIMIGQLVICVLGVIVITGEYGTGQIRSSIAAVPRRLPLLWGKGLVFAAATVVVSAISIFVTFFAAVAILDGQGYRVDLASDQPWGQLIGGVAYLALIGLFAYAIGAMLRSTAGAIAAALGILLVLPNIVGLVPVQWIANLAKLMPNALGQVLYAPPMTGSVGELILEPWQALLAMLGWVAVLLTGAAIQLRRRDV